MNNRSFIITVCALLLALGGGGLIGLRPVPQVVKTNLEKLPMVIGDYRGVEDSFSDAVYEGLNADKHVYRHYTDSNGNRVSLYIGYYGTAKGGRTGHNPYACFPSSGWAIIDSESVAMADNKVNYMLVKNDDIYETVLHWYQSDKDKILASGLQQNLQRFWGRLLHNRNDGAFVRVTARVSEPDIVVGKKRITQFAEKLVPLLAKNWPEES